MEYTTDVQKFFLSMMITEPNLFVRVQNILNPENFDRTLKDTVKFMIDFSNKYHVIPDVEKIRLTTSVELTRIADLREQDTEWFFDEFEKFTRKQELERAILKSAELLEKGNYDPVEKIIKDAVQISLTKDLGTDYFDDPKGRLLAIKQNNGQMSTGWPVLDNKLYGGFNRGELQLFLGGSGSGKSLFMQNLAVNWVREGLNGVYITLELSENLCSWRIDSMMTDIATKEIFKNIDDVELKIKMAQKKSGRLFVKYLPAQSNINDIRSYCRELQVQTEKKLDFMCIDYMDLLMPVSVKISASDLFTKDKFVSEELRNFAKELNVLFVTASQLNRSAVEEVEFDHSHISGGISKINTADNVFGIFTSRNMRERGQYQVQLMKTRSSSGVGQKVNLRFNVDTLRIYDDESDDDVQQTTTSSILDQIKVGSNVIESKVEESVKVPTASMSTNLKAKLAQIKGISS
jgi:KaiC/GvpD/RAD55 family RecA-like ATPase